MAWYDSSEPCHSVRRLKGKIKQHLSLTRARLLKPAAMILVITLTEKAQPKAIASNLSPAFYPAAIASLTLYVSISLSLAASGADYPFQVLLFKSITVVDYGRYSVCVKVRSM